jgi:hypothetical protein
MSFTHNARWSSAFSYDPMTIVGSTCLVFTLFFLIYYLSTRSKLSAFLNHKWI